MTPQRDDIQTALQLLAEAPHSILSTFDTEVLIRTERNIAHAFKHLDIDKHVTAWLQKMKEIIQSYKPASNLQPLVNKANRVWQHSKDPTLKEYLDWEKKNRHLYDKGPAKADLTFQFCKEKGIERKSLRNKLCIYRVIESPDIRHVALIIGIHQQKFCNLRMSGSLSDTILQSEAVRGLCKQVHTLLAPYAEKVLFLKPEEEALPAKSEALEETRRKRPATPESNVANPNKHIRYETPVDWNKQDRELHGILLEDPLEPTVTRASSFTENLGSLDNRMLYPENDDCFLDSLKTVYLDLDFLMPVSQTQIVQPQEDPM